MLTKFESNAYSCLQYIENVRLYAIHFVSANGRPFMIYQKWMTVCDRVLYHICTSVYDILQTDVHMRCILLPQTVVRF